MRLQRTVGIVLFSFLVPACGGSSSHGGNTPTTHAISGTVRDASGATGLEGVIMSLSGCSTRSATTGEDGGFSFADLEDGDCVVAPSRAGFTFTPSSTPVTLRAADRRGVDFTAHPAAPALHAISGLVAGVCSAGLEILLTGEATRSATTDAEGRFSFGGLPDGAYTVTPSASGLRFSPERLDLTLDGADRTTGLTFGNSAHPSLAIAGRISGTEDFSKVLVVVSEAGRLVTGGYVSIDDGSYTLSGLGPCSYVVRPASVGDVHTFSPPSATAPGGATGVDFSVE